MRSTMLKALAATGIFFGSASAQNYDNHHRALQRARDMALPTPLSNQEERSLRSLISKGTLNVIPQNLAVLPEVVDNDAVSRAQRLLKAPKGAVAPMPEVEGNSKRLGVAGRGAPQVGGRSHEHPQEVDLSGHEYEEREPHYSESEDVEMGDDDDDDDDDGPGYAGPDYVEMYLEGLQDGRGLQGAIVPNPSQPDQFDIGSLYLWNEEPILALEESTNSTSGAAVDEFNQLATVTGRCVRTDPFDELDSGYTGRAYCQYVYEIVDEVDGQIYELTAEGPIAIGAENVLSITGGTGIYSRAVGQIILTPVDDSALPSVETSAMADLPTSFLMQAYIYMDQNQLSIDLLGFFLGFLDAFN